MSRKPRILLYDCETKPVKAWVWRTSHKYNVTNEAIVEGEKFDIICICWKFLGESRVHSLDWGLRKQNSEEMIKKFGEVIESADVVIAHNGDKFDAKQLNTQRLMHDLPPLAWPTSQDTLKALRKQFYLTSFKLDYVAKLLFGSGKDPMCFQDWVDIVDKKDPKALKKMIKYCKKDVLLLEKVWKRVEKHLDLKYHAGVIGSNDRESCPSCQSKNIIRWSRSYTRTGFRQRLKCNDCGKTWTDSNKILKNK